MPKHAAPAEGAAKASTKRRRAPKRVQELAAEQPPPSSTPPKPSKARKTKSTKKKKSAAKKVAKAPSTPPVQASRATILPSQRVDHTTPPIVLEGVVYPVLGDPVDLDPCSNEKSIVRARRALTKKDDGLSIEWRVRTVYCNPPYGKDKASLDAIIDWIRKCVMANRLYGAGVIALVPANVSAEWWDLVVATATAIGFWGPGEGNRRIKFGGNKNQAAFHSALVYWGPDVADFALHAGRFCHMWYPGYDLTLTRALIGGRPRPEEHPLPIEVAEQVLSSHRDDDLVAALACAGQAKLGQILDLDQSALRERVRSLSCAELATALMLASRARSRPWVHAAELPLRTGAPENPRQMKLLAGLLEAAEKPPPEIPDRYTIARTLEDAVVAQLDAVPDGLRRAELLKRVACTSGELKGALQRLVDARRITMTGRTRAAIYRLPQHQEKQDEARDENPRHEEPGAAQPTPRQVQPEPVQQPDQSTDFWPGPAG